MKKIRKILSNFFDALPLDSHREYVSSSVDQGNADLYVTLALVFGALLNSWGYSIYSIIVGGIVLHIANFLAWRAEPLHHKAMRHKQ